MAADIPSRGDIDCMFRNRAVRVTDSAFADMYAQDIEPNVLCSMLQGPIECPGGKKGKPHRRNLIQVCAARKGKIFSILLANDYSMDTSQEVFGVVHLKPIA
jgi:hypothetical protein